MATPRFNPNRPIPNDPFYSPLTNALGTAQGPLIIGAGLSIDYSTFTLTATGGGGGAVNQVTGSGAGISVTPTTGNVVVTNTGVTALLAGPGITLSGATGSVTICSAGGGGTVTCVGTGVGLTGGPINTTGALCLATVPSVTAGAYTNANITVDAYGRVTSATNGTVSGGTVTSLTACCGIITNPAGGVTTTGSVALSNTGVTAATYNYATITVDAQGRITNAVSNTPTSGTVTCVCTGTGLTGGPFSTTGTIALCNTAVTPGSYTNASFTVDQQGRLTSANSGPAPVTSVTGSLPISVSTGSTPNVSIANASTTALGAVQLYDALNSASTTLALTAAQGCCLQSQINALTASGTIELAGTIDASTGLMVSVTSVGTADGYTVGAVLPAASSTTENTYAIVTTPGTFTPPGGSATAATRGDWFLVTQTSPGVYAWSFLNVGFDAPAATTTTAGIVCLSTNALAQAGTDTTTALTPAAAASAYIPKSTVTGLGVVLTGTAAGAPAALPAGPDNCALIACAACPCGLTWGAAGGIAATPTVAGVVFGCTVTANTGNVSLGYQASNLIATKSVHIGYQTGCADSGDCNTFVGFYAGQATASGVQNIAIGYCAYAAANVGSGNVALGSQSLLGSGQGNPTSFNIAIGAAALCQVCGSSNVAIGDNAGCLLTGSSNCNVLIGPGVQAPTIPGSCQLAIGYSPTANWLTGDNTKAIKPGAGIIDCAGSCGTGGQVLMSNGSNAICWGTIGNATPTVFGLIQGCTTSSNTSLGCSALLTGLGGANVAVGKSALCSTAAGGVDNVAVGLQAGLAITSGSGNVAIGTSALISNLTSSCNVAVGGSALGLATGGCNVALGVQAGDSITTGTQNVAIGPYVEVASATGSCQLAIGFSPTANWLTGDSSKNIQPGAGIKDCAASVGTAGQILSSTGTAIKWRSGVVQQTASCTAAVTLATEITTRGLSNGDSLTIYNSNTLVSATNVTVTAASLTNYQTYPTQATATVFTVPPQGSVTVILADAVTNTWYIESYDTPAQVGTVVAKATLSSNFTFTSDSKIPLSSAPVNPQGYFNTTTNRFQPLVAGYYQINAQLFGDSGNWMIAQIKKNGAVEIQTEQTSSPNSEAVPLSGIVYLNGSTDYLELWGITPASTTLSSQPQSTYFTASLINQTNTRVVGIDAAASMIVTAGTIPSSAGITEVTPGINGVTVAEDFDPQSWFDTTTGRFTPTIPGYYQVDTVVTSNNSANNLWGGFFKNGVIYGQAIQTVTSSTGNWNSATYSAVVFMNGTTDYLRLGAGMQGSTAGFANNQGTNRMSISLVGANQAQPIPPMTWINAGTVQSVGIGAVISGTTNPGTAPTILAATQNNIRYRQIGPKEWEVQGILYFTNGTAGNGDYVFTLPGNLQFDLTSPYQLPYTIQPNFAAGWYSFGLPNAWAMFSQSGAVTIYQSLVMPFDATRYRIVPVGPNSEYFWSSAYYGIGGYSGWRKWGFTFFTP